MKKNDICLLIDASNAWIALGLHSDTISYEKRLHAPREGFTALFPLLEDLLKEADVKKPDWIACLYGPGSFTGSRISTGTARNLAQLWEIPVLGLNSLASYIYALPVRKKSPVAVMLDAKQKKVYAGMTLPDASESKLLELTGEDIEPGLFIEKLPDECVAYCDSPGTIAGYINESTALSVELLELPPPETGSFYEFALYSGGIEAAGSYNNLMPLYLRSDPAHQKYPEGYNRNH